MSKEVCPECGYKAVRARFNDFVCDRCKTVFDKKWNVMGVTEKHFNGQVFKRDEDGNFFYATAKNDGKFITIKTVYLLEEGKTTLRGEYNKLNPNCPFTERLDCNHGCGYERCVHMKFVRSGESLFGKGGRWECSYTY